jgi:hypothetical protein
LTSARGTDGLESGKKVKEKDKGDAKVDKNIKYMLKP